MNELEKLRAEIDKCDDMIAKYYARRMELVEAVGEYKRQYNTPVLQSDREKIVLDRVGNVSEMYKKDIIDLYQYILTHSKNRQKGDEK